jgi:hypothetical protein
MTEKRRELLRGAVQEGVLPVPGKGQDTRLRWLPLTNGKRLKLVAANGSPTELGAFYNELQPEASHLDGYQRRTEERDGKTYGWTLSGRRVLLRKLVDGKAKLTGAGRAYYHTNRVRFVAHVPTINNADDRYWLDYRPVTDQRLNIDLPSSMDGRDGPPNMDALRDRLQSMYEAKLFARAEVNPIPSEIPPLPDASRSDGERRALPLPNKRCTTTTEDGGRWMCSWWTATGRAGRRWRRF